MKKAIIILISVFTISLQNAVAQESKGQSFILATYSTNMGSQNHQLPRSFFSQQNGSYLYVNAKNPNYALRYGIGIGQRYQNINSNTFVQQDTTFRISTYSESAIPRLIVGKEWRKNLHPDVMIIGGADLSLGGGASRYNSLIESEFKNGNTTNLSNYKNGFALYGGFTPFTGLRVSWGRLALSYTASLPMELDALFQNNNSSQAFNMNFAHNISAGYRIFNTKK